MQRYFSWILRSCGSHPQRVRAHTATWEERRWIYVLQTVFFLVGLLHLNGPFVSCHYPRQNLTFDVAQHVFHDGWKAVLVPRASYSKVELPSQPYGIYHLNFPFHGLLGWPAALLAPQYERAVVRLVSLVFALYSILLVHRVLRHWLDASASLLGTAVWAASPLLLHFGQVPMPDILATTGMMAAFVSAQRGIVVMSSVWFLFSLLAKMSVIPFGFPILVALCVARACGSWRRFLVLGAAWGTLPLLGVLGWIALGLADPPGSTVFVGWFTGRSTAVLENPWSVSCLLGFLGTIAVFGCGLIGTLGLVAAPWTSAVGMNLWVKVATLVAVVVYYYLGRVGGLEPQYSLPPSFWGIVVASFGLSPILSKLREARAFHVWAIVVVLLHMVLLLVGALFLKMSRVPNQCDVAAAGRFLPPNARVVVWGDFKGTCDAQSVWLGRNTLSYCHDLTPARWESGWFLGELERLRPLGYSHLLVFDDEARLSFRLGKGLATGYSTDYAGLSSPFRRWCDVRFKKLFEGEHVVLYALP